MQIANVWADGEDSIRNERQDTPEEDNDPWNRGGGRNFDWRLKRKARQYDDEATDLVAAGFPENLGGRSRNDDRQNERGRGGGYRGDGPRRREWQPRIPRDEARVSCTAAQ